MSTNENLISNEERIEVLSSRVKLLFEFCYELIPYLDLLEEAYKGAEEKENFSHSGAVLLEAFNIDSEEKRMEWKLRKDRAKAIYDLVNVLKESEEKRKLFKEKRKERESVIKQLGL